VATSQDLSIRRRRPAVATSLAQLARRYPDLSPEEQTAVRHLVGMWVKDD
jgi:hypothetical protein